MVNIFVQDPKFEIQESIIREAIEKLVGEDEVNVFFVGEEEMRQLHHKYMAAQGYEEELHDVLSFPTEDTKPGPDGIKRLGDIVICYPYAVSQNEDLVELVKHGTMHLLGQHHQS